MNLPHEGKNDVKGRYEETDRIFANRQSVNRNETKAKEIYYYKNIFKKIYFVQIGD